MAFEITRKKIIFGILIFLLSQIFSGIAGFTIVDPLIHPIKDSLYPPIADVSFEPFYLPTVKDGAEFLTIIVRNTGDKTLNNAVIDYKFGTGKKSLEGRDTILSLTPTEEHYLQIGPSLVRLNCSLIQEMKCKLYVDDEEKICYHDCPVLETCNLKILEISLKSEEIEKTFNTVYPVYGNFWVNFGLDGYGECLRNMSAQDKENLRFYDYLKLDDIGLYAPAYCAQNILPQERCVKEGFSYSTEPTYTITIGNLSQEIHPFPTL